MVQLQFVHLDREQEQLVLVLVRAVALVLHRAFVLVLVLHSVQALVLVLVLVGAHQMQVSVVVQQVHDWLESVGPLVWLLWLALLRLSPLFHQTCALGRFLCSLSHRRVLSLVHLIHSQRHSQSHVLAPLLSQAAQCH
jgi:hypothetical protein